MDNAGIPAWVAKSPLLASGVADEWSARGTDEPSE
jgi:hypothetical protein